MTALEIRRAEPGDAPAIARVLYQSFMEFKPLYTEGGFAATALDAGQILIRMGEGPVWIAVQEEAVVGTVAAVRKEQAFYIRGMAVLPQARGLGAGTALLLELENWAFRERANRLFLSTTPFLASAIRMYEGFGFRRIAEDPQDLFGTPLFTMEKLLGR